MRVSFDKADLEPLIETCLARVLDKFGDPAQIAYSEATAAKLLDIDAGTLGAERRAGYISGVKIGRSWHYQRSDLLEFIAERRKLENGD